MEKVKDWVREGREDKTKEETQGGRGRENRGRRVKRRERGKHRVGEGRGKGREEGRERE